MWWRKQRLVHDTAAVGDAAWRVARLAPAGLQRAVAEAITPPWRRVATELEGAVYGACQTISDRFADESGYGGHDPLSSD